MTLVLALNKPIPLICFLTEARAKAVSFSRLSSFDGSEGTLRMRTITNAFLFKNKIKHKSDKEKLCIEENENGEENGEGKGVENRGMNLEDNSGKKGEEPVEENTSIQYN